MNKKFITKSIIFVLIFVLLWSFFQNLLSYKYDFSFKERLQDYRNDIEKMGSGFDVVIIGSSPSYVGIAPAVMWNEQGFTTYNFGHPRVISPISYFLLEYLFEDFEKPKVVVLELTNIRREKEYDANDVQFRSILEGFENIRIKNEAIDWICNRYDKNTKISFYLPLLRYHSRWDSLEEKDFTKEEYKTYTKGTDLRTKQVALNWDKVYPAQTKKILIDEYAEYYQKIIDLCKDNNVELLINIVPKMQVHQSDYEFVVELCKKNNIKLLSYISVEERESLGLNVKTDFYDPGHMNVLGQRKYSVILAKYLTENFDIGNHKNDSRYSYWNDFYRQYQEEYNMLKENMVHD